MVNTILSRFTAVETGCTDCNQGTSLQTCCFHFSKLVPGPSGPKSSVLPTLSHLYPMEEGFGGLKMPLGGYLLDEFRLSHMLIS